MKYQFSPAPFDPESRKTLNEKVLYLIDSGTSKENGITPEDIYNAYTGDGGLHGLERADFDNYHDYSEKKKEIENGQFFTPPEICQLIAESIAPSDCELVADLTCGKGSFFNFLPSEANLYGCELDTKAFKVAQYLYPEANLTLGDIRAYKPDIRFDYIVGNPPYNLRWYVEGGEYSSQLYYCMKAADLLKPLGILALVVPQSFLADKFTDKGMIREMEGRFSFIGQIGLPDNAFRALGVEKYKTKLQFWQKRSEAAGWAANRYSTDLLYSLNTVAPGQTAEKIRKEVLLLAKSALEKNRGQVFLELAKEKNASADFVYQTQKMLYQIKVHPAIRDRYMKCCEYLHRFYTEEKPEEMNWKEWERKRLTEKKVLAYLRQTLVRQNEKPVDKIALVKHDYSLAYKAYSYKARSRMENYMHDPVTVNQAVLGGSFGRFPGFERLLRRKQREYENQSQKFSEMAEDFSMNVWLRSFTPWDAENEEYIHLNDLQCHDINLMLQKRYGLLQWEQGSGSR